MGVEQHASAGYDQSRPAVTGVFSKQCRHGARRRKRQFMSRIANTHATVARSHRATTHAMVTCARSPDGRRRPLRDHERGRRAARHLCRASRRRRPLRRDFVLIGDGWEKDGDYNTAYSQTVLPLPTHSRSPDITRQRLRRSDSRTIPCPGVTARIGSGTARAL